MIRITGKANDALCFANAIEPAAQSQIEIICQQEAFRDSRIRVMPDVHAGKGCCIGLTMTIHHRVSPALVGVDIGCGMLTVYLEEKNIDCDQLDRVIRRYIPVNMAIHETPHPLAEKAELNELRCKSQVNLQRALLSVGTLGGGNHFIEIDRRENGHLCLVIHTGSRHAGAQTAQAYQNIAWEGLLREASRNTRSQAEKIIRELKMSGRQNEIGAALRRLDEESRPDIPQELAWLEGAAFEDYLHDMKIIQRFADINRQAIAGEILRGMNWHETGQMTTMHNYIDTEQMILRKGAVSAKEGERILLPMNMRDGSLICVGKGNPDWNFSAPHGAGRQLSRTQARACLTMDDYYRAMEGVYSTSVRPDTLDESPMAYKPMRDITDQILPTVDVMEVLSPVYNFKA